MFLWALMASVQTLLVPVPALTLSPEVRKASLPMPALMKSALLPLPGHIKVCILTLKTVRIKY